MSAFSSIISGLSGWNLRAKIRNDDGIDQLHHFVTTAILATFAAFSAFYEFVSDPLNCWNDGTYIHGHFQKHVNQYCWTNALYRYPDDDNHSVVPFTLNSIGAPVSPDEIQDRHKIKFYQSVTVMFIIQACLFKMPNLFWNEFNARSGSNIQKMVQKLQEITFAEKDAKKRELELLSKFMEKWLRMKKNNKLFFNDASSRVQAGKLSSKTLTYVYLFTKALFLINIFVQYAILCFFLNTNFFLLGPYTLITNRNSAYLPIFPSVGLCNFQTYESPSATGRWVQCLLVINIWVEKMLLIEWFWLPFLLLVTVFSFITWIYRAVSSQSNMTFVKRLCRLIGEHSDAAPMPEKHTLKQFTDQYLGDDGVLVLRILAANSNDVTVGDLTSVMWNKFSQQAISSTQVMMTSEIL